MRQFLFLFLFLPALPIYAQEAIAVSKEPFHKNVFENEYVRVLDVRIHPGDTTMFHKHKTPSVFISLHPVRTGSQVIIEDGSATALSPDHTITFEGFYKSPRIHRVWNADTSLFHVMDIEVLTKGDRNIGAPIAINGFKQIFDAPPVRTSRVTLKAHWQLELIRSCPVLIVGLNDAGKVLVNKKPFTSQGDFLFVSPSEKIELVNNDEHEYSLTVMELK
ncbi:MAG: hypothetical protein ABI760_10305 [Ferruginibacter sp.]